eukprot:5570707-Prymnesium_polylepis.1
MRSGRPSKSRARSGVSQITNSLEARHRCSGQTKGNRRGGGGRAAGARCTAAGQSIADGSVRS